MKKTSTFTRTLGASMLALLSLLLICVAAETTLAQDETSEPAQVRNRQQIRNAAQEPQGETLRQRIRERIENEQGLQDQEREQLRQHLRDCERLEFDDGLVAALFSDGVSLREQLRTQERVMTLAREGLPVEPVAQKLQEGRRKGVGQGSLERVCARIAEQVRAAHRFMERAREEGLTPGEANAERRNVQEMAANMWRGLKEDEMERLQKRARERLRDGSCTTEQLVVAAETATRLAELGIERNRAVRVAGDALQHGYTAREMRQLAWMVMTAHMHGSPLGDVMDEIETGFRNQRQLSQMVQEMWQRGWLGPADEHGSHGPMDDAPGSGPGGHRDEGSGGSGQESGGQGSGKGK
ncbi:MAG: hypothetical protein JSW03_00860 [Candidatus Eiseniibacteriota bacterium]|nr:MAG: hypothetical protein JSW03_00860 [Candidatus Eisenbacteria bacterium]